jgi:prophage DNA circulation protein
MRMVSEWDKYPRCSFAGIEFPIEDADVDGGYRSHEHEYWKADGADVEKGGRKPYHINVTGIFDARFRKYVGLYPDRLDKLIRYFELGRTERFVHPSFGSMQMFSTSWKIHYSAKIRSGERVIISMQEDEIDPVREIEVTDPTSKNLATGASTLAAKLAGVQLPRDDLALFDQIRNVSNQIFAIKDTADQYGQRVGAQIEQLARLCRNADALISTQDPKASPITEALHDLWAAANKIAQDVQSKRVGLQRYITPTMSSIGQIAMALYDNDASRAENLLALNSGSFIDAYRIPAGTAIVYYPED